ncbi:hypothetical protein H2200_009139 [Cladophialophora chaetospira]|uniref:Uncharacterized protein n=1 Tax=Cladophialophora chaetospira TaxID=386627 RepID=A0AA38X3U4_9EURO|nr:hypothetical protein H2200_009139 [Cladophialophora chaetospira]
MSTTRYVAAGAATFGALLYFWPKASPGIPGAPAEGFKSTGIQNVEKAYQRGGATSTHTKGYGGTPQGATNDAMREGGSSGNPNAYDKEGLGEDQRPSSKTKVEETFNKTMLGNEKGK